MCCQNTLDKYDTQTEKKKLNYIGIYYIIRYHNVFYIDKRGINTYFSYFSMKTYVVVHIRSTEVPLMSTHYMCFFCEKISKISLLFRLKKKGSLSGAFFDEK